MITGDPSLGKSVEAGNAIGKDGVIQQGTPSGPPHEGSREIYEGRIISVPRDYCWTPCVACNGCCMSPQAQRLRLACHL